MSIFKGSGVALVTPFNETGINYEALGELIEFQIKNGTDSIVICGTTGETATMTEEEHLACVKYTVAKVDKRVPVVAGCGSNNTEHALHLTKAVEELGVDAALIVTPYYNKTTQKGLYEHYKYIAENTKLPIMLYNVPGRTGLFLKPQTIAKLAEIENIVALKEASGDLSHVAEVMALCGDKIDLYSGCDDQVLPIMSLGGLGVVTVAGNIIPKEMHEMTHAYLEGDHKKSLSLQLNYLDLINGLFCEVNPIPVKTSLNEMGYNVGHCRRPLTTMEDENYSKLKYLLNGHKLISND